MPYLPQSEKDKDKEQEQGATPMLSSTAGAPVMGTPALAGSGGTKGPTSSGAWTNLQQYIKANQGEGMRMGEKVAGDIGTVGEQARTGLGAASEQFKTEAEKTPQYRQELGQAVANAPTQMTPEQRQAFQSELTAQYKGLENLNKTTGYEDVLAKIRGTETKIGQSKTEGGRKELLTESYARPTYTGGEKRLDQMMLQNAPGAASAFEKVAGKYGTLGEEQTKAEQEAAALKEQKTAQAAETKGRAEGEFKGALTQREKAVQDRMNQLQAERQANIERERQRIAGTWGPTYLQALGRAPTDYLTVYEAPTGIETAATPEEQAQFQALQEIAGVNPALMDQTAARIAAANPNVVGTYGKAPAYSFNEAAMKADIARAEQQYNQEKAAIMSRIGAVTERTSQADIDALNALNARYGLDERVARPVQNKQWTTSTSSRRR